MRRLAHKRKIIGGLPLGKFYPELGKAAVWCATELPRARKSTPRPASSANESGSEEVNA